MKNKKANFFKGFTLIELLVVIAIIGILATVILNSLTQSQAKAYNSKIAQQLNSFRTAAQMYFINHAGYGPATSACNDGMFNDVDTQDGSPGLYIATGNLPDFSQVTCNSTIKDYALKATLYSGTDYWCVDSTGASRSLSGTPNNGTICP